MQPNLELPISSSGHGDLMLPLVKVKFVEVVLENELPFFMSPPHSVLEAGGDR